jgi:hypothetical protein
MGILSQVHFPPSTFTDLLQYPVVGDRISDHDTLRVMALC